MKIATVSFVIFAWSGVLIAQQAPPGAVVSSVAVSVRDGFTKSGTAVLLTRNGVSQKVEKEVALKNGLVVRSDGSVTLPNGAKAILGNNQILTLDGVFEEVALSPEGTAPVLSGGSAVKQSKDAGSPAK